MTKPNSTGRIPLPSAEDIGAIPSSEKAVADGVATLDSNAKIPVAQIPEQGLILPSPDGSRWEVSVDNSGNLITTAL